jgi:glycosyltransferase involved in cell wall biosynthesis
VAVGYLGGADQRKGLHEVLALTSEPDLHVLLAGPKSERLDIGGRRGLGFVEVGAFVSACDVIVAPTLFDPAPVAVLESLSRGVPVVTTAASGWSNAIERHGCGVIWDSATVRLADACRRAAGTPGDRCHAFTKEFASAQQREILIKAYEQVLECA